MPPPLEVSQNDLTEPDPARARELEIAIRAAVPAGADLSCSFLLVGFPRDRLRVELRGTDWCENLPLLPADVPATTVGALAGDVVERRRRPRGPAN
jgi:hypothetical protein